MPDVKIVTVATPRPLALVMSAAFLALSLSTLSALACMRPTMDERAVQWSDAIVEAKLASIGSEVKLGEVQERRGALGALGTANITYFYRLYTFDVTRTLDGSLKAGEKLQVVRLFSKTEEPAVSGAATPAPPPSTDSCSQLLIQQNVGKQFIVLARELSKFKAVVPNGVTPPNVKNATWIVYLASKDSINATAMEQLTSTITSVRETESHIDPARVERLIGQIEYAQNDERAGPSVRALEKLGTKVVPTVQQAAMKTNGQARSRLLQVVSDLTPTEPIVQVEAMKSEQGR